MDSSSAWYQDQPGLVASLQRWRQAQRPLPAIEGYDVLYELRRGGQGVVYAATQRSTRRRVALKTLAENALVEKSRRQRFEREMELVAGLRHPGIVAVYDCGVAADAQPFLVMEFIDGVPLDEWWSEWQIDGAPSPHASRADVAVAEAGPLAPSRQTWLARRSAIRGPKPALVPLLRLFTRICDAVSAAHQRGVIHRDLKPSNILVDAAGEPHVLDFGLAKLHADAQSHISSSEAFLGTLAYAAPEQLLAPAAVDTRSDVYALGVILYEMLAGAPPYVTSGPLADVIHAVTQSEPPAPSHMLRRRLDAAGRRRGRIDRDLDTIVLGALAKDPQRRYQSVDALRRDVERWLRGDAIEARRGSAIYVLGKLARRHWPAAVLSAGLLAAVVAFAAGMTVLCQRARVEAEKSRQIRFFLEDTLASIEPRAPGAPVTLREVLDEAVHWVDLALSDQPEVAASVRTTIGNSLRALGDYDAAETQIRAALLARQELLGPEHVDVAQSLNLLGLLERDRRNLAEADRLLREGLALRRRLLGGAHPDVALSLGNLASVLCLAGHSDEAESALRDALGIRIERYGERHADTAMSQFALAQLLAERGDAAAAQALHRAALDTRQQLLHPDHPDIRRSLSALADLRP
jgi:serine/threonine protein kinase